MTTTYDPDHEQYLDEADVRDELARVFDLCNGCRRCIDRCTAFPSMFEMLERDGVEEAGDLTPAQQDRVVQECFHCKLCAVNCPYVPPHEWQLDFPRLMLRAAAMRRATDQVPNRSRLTTGLMGRTQIVGTVATSVSSVSNAAIAKPGSLRRKLMAKVVGVSAVRMLPPFTKQRFSSWFKLRQRVHAANRQGAVTVFPTCLVEYNEPAIGRDLVRVYERNGIDCRLTEARCCGAPWLYAGDVERFQKIARRNVAALAEEVRAGTDVVVPQPTCSHVLRRDYVDHVGGADADLVAEHTYDAAEYLMRLHDGDDTTLDTEFPGTVPTQLTYHAPCHLRAQGTSSKSRDLLRLTGARVRVVERCSASDAGWGLRAENEAIATSIAEKLAEQVVRADPDAVAGDCHLANTAIAEYTGRRPQHPLQIVARAYGIPPD